jgi:hypothetical protein
VTHLRDQAREQLTILPLNGLANGTEMAASLGDADAHNNSAAARTRLAGTPEHIEYLGVAPGSGAREIKVGLARAQSGTHVPEPIVQHFWDSPMKGTGLAPGERPAVALRVDTGHPEGLIDIDISQAGQEALIEQQRFDLPVSGFQHGRKSS